MATSLIVMSDASGSGPKPHGLLTLGSSLGGGGAPVSVDTGTPVSRTPASGRKQGLPASMPTGNCGCMTITPPSGGGTNVGGGWNTGGRPASPASTPPSKNPGTTRASPSSPLQAPSTTAASKVRRDNFTCDIGASERS